MFITDYLQGAGASADCEEVAQLGTNVGMMYIKSRYGV